MYTTFQAVALRTVKHNERSAILTAWTPAAGRIAIVMPAGNTPESRRRRALTMPLCLFEAAADFRPGTDLYRVRDLHPWHPDIPAGSGIPAATHPARAMVAMFLAEILEKYTREGQADPALWQLVIHTVATLDSATCGRTLSLIPVAFLMRLAAIAGIAPDMDARQPGTGLDLAEGVFRATPPLHGHWLTPGQTRLVMTLARCARHYSHLDLINLDLNSRRQLLDGMLDFFNMHNIPLTSLKSLAVLRAL